ncbi:13992_t:CDS:2 [Gigaspora rosea]|nr:13992_t:CDS:2 [Gigaspora rosea]
MNRRRNPKSIYYEGFEHESRRDYSSAFNCYQRTKCNKEGVGTNMDLNLAFHWYLKSAERGDRDAMRNVMRCFEEGIGTPIDQSRALYWRTRLGLN